MNGVFCQTSTRTTDTIDMNGLENQSKYTSRRPNWRPRLLMAPYLTPNIMRHAMPAITGETMAGIASRAVMMGRPWVTRLSRSAMPRPRSSSHTRAGTMRMTVFQTEAMKRSSRNSASV